MTKQVEDTGIELSSEDKKRRMRRSLAIGLALGFLVVLFYAITLFKFPGTLDRPL